MNVETKTENIQSHPKLARQWDDELANAIVISPQTWQEPGYNAFHYAKVGLLVGSLAGCTSLLINVIGSVLWPAISGEAQHPLRLIQVYLTFPFGEAALQFNNGFLLALGCVLYLSTGMLYGTLFVLTISCFLPHAGVQARLVACSIMALFVWMVNFYLLIAWLQPLFFGGHWIAQLVPWWVGALTHLIFGWTMALLYPVSMSTQSKPQTGTVGAA